ncbi:hypothetical protein GCM10012278_54680 [Nonomuraea glycinis]|uniref:Uncharacterized protein n=1 Tax=Nonomuraea glycinis TaxID=2047744 RepID=A0A918A884_9ACTN|nr:hypothetical protein GCM10012278_54680 [Nonomuraea glycinis]
MADPAGAQARGEHAEETDDQSAQERGQHMAFDASLPPIELGEIRVLHCAFTHVHPQAIPA